MCEGLPQQAIANPKWVVITLFGEVCDCVVFVVCVLKDI